MTRRKRTRQPWHQHPGRVLNMSRVREYVEKGRCVRCGEDNPVVLEFHHRNPGKKIDSPKRMAGGGWSWESISREINKCDLLCANCHLITHHEMRAKGRKS